MPLGRGVDMYVAPDRWQFMACLRCVETSLFQASSSLGTWHERANTFLEATLSEVSSMVRPITTTLLVVLIVSPAKSGFFH